jgi:hypothetical protein
MGSGLLGTNLGSGRGFFGFDPTPGGSLTQNSKTFTGSSNAGVTGSKLNDNVGAVQKKPAPKPAGSSAPSNNNGGNGGYGGDTGSYQGNTGPYSGSGGSTAGQDNSADLAYLDDQEGLLRALLGRSGEALNQGITQIGDDYNREVNGANAQQSRVLSDFATKREDTTSAKMGALDKVDTNARTLANSVRQILARAAGSGSSAYQIAAPGAIARDASIDRTSVQDNYGRNFRDLKTGEDRAVTDFGSLLEDLARQKGEKEHGLREGVLSQEQGVYGQLADLARQKAAVQGGGYDSIRAASAPMQGEIASRQSAIDGLFNQYRTPFSVKPVDVQTPNLRDYSFDRSAVNAPGQQQQVGAQYNPYSQFLNKRDEKDQLL